MKIPTSSKPSANIVANGDFRRGLAGWTIDNSAGGSVQVEGGRALMRVRGPGSRARLRQELATRPGRLYRLSHKGSYAERNKYGTSIGVSFGGSEIGAPVIVGSFLFFARQDTTHIGFSTDIDADLRDVRCEEVENCNFMKTNGFMTSQHLKIYDRDQLSPLKDTEGVLISFHWRQVENETEGKYDFSLLDTAVAYAKARGKSVVLRLQIKTFTDANSPPKQLIWPDYVMRGDAYGGESPTFGLAKQWQNSGGTGGKYTWIGWSPLMHRPLLRDRLVAMLTAVADHYEREAYVLGFSLDEVLANISTFHRTNPPPYWPYDATDQGLYDGYRDYMARAKAAVGAKELWICCNYWDNPDSWAKAKELARYTVELGARIGLTDVFYRGHEEISATSDGQPTYPQYAAQPLGGLAAIDFADYHAADEKLEERCYRMMEQSKAMGSVITAWYAREIRNDQAQTDPRFWEAARKAFA